MRQIWVNGAFDFVSIVSLEAGICKCVVGTQTEPALSDCTKRVRKRVETTSGPLANVEYTSLVSFLR